MKYSNYTNGMSIVLLRASIVNAGVFYTYEKLNMK